MDGDKILLARKKMGYTQPGIVSELWTRFGIITTKQNISKFESGGALNPDIETLHAIYIILELDRAELLPLTKKYRAFLQEGSNEIDGLSEKLELKTKESNYWQEKFLAEIANKFKK